jgi:hypothetical protein
MFLPPVYFQSLFGRGPILKTSLLLLPKVPMRGRPADPGVGFFYKRFNYLAQREDGIGDYANLVTDLQSAKTRFSYKSGNKEKSGE